MPHIRPTRLALVGAIAAASFIALSHVWAGPPLLCPATVLTPVETQEMSDLLDTADPAACARAVVARLDRSESSRHRIESLRYVWQTRGPELADAIARALAKSPARATSAQRRFELSLIRVIAGWNVKDAILEVGRLLAIAEGSDDPMLWITAAEALDLVTDGWRTPHVARHAALSLSLHRRACTRLQTLATDEQRLLARLLAVHFEKTVHMHDRSAELDALQRDIQALAARAAKGV